MKTKKKGLHQKWNTFFPNSSGDLRSDAHQSQIIGGDADVGHTQIIGGRYIPPGLGTTGLMSSSRRYIQNDKQYTENNLMQYALSYRDAFRYCSPCTFSCTVISVCRRRIVHRLNQSH